MARFIQLDVIEAPDDDWYSHPETINTNEIVRFYDAAKYPDGGSTHAVVELRNGTVLHIYEMYDSLAKRIKAEWLGGIT